MIEAGEDPLFIARRMVIFASEDVGNADPRALQIAISVKDAVDFVGLPEGVIPLAQGVTYLASAPKSNASYVGIDAALACVRKSGALPVPLHIRNAPTRLMKELGYHKGYRYDHDFAEGYAAQEYQGSRYGFGYPSCPDLTAHRDVFRLLKPENIGVTLTENMEMIPEQSTSAIIAHHPQAKYFTV